MSLEEAATRMGLTADRFRDFCVKWRIVEASLFGSALREDFGPESDIDLLVVFADDAKWTLFGIVKLKLELEELVGRDVDIVERSALEKSDRIARDEILRDAQRIYVA